MLITIFMRLEVKSFGAMGEAHPATTSLGHLVRTDEHGKQVVEVPIREYEEMLERLEDAEDIAIIDERQNDPTIPWDDVKKRLRMNEPA
jgi:hypothetical protein